MAEVGRGLSKRLRDPAGEYAVDLIIALTHARVPNDLALGRALGALSPRAQKDSEKEGKSFANEHGADLILGGHDHLYFVSKGVDSWENYDLTANVLGAEDDDGSVLVIKSGTDFRDLSSFDLELSQTSEGNVRRRVISKITGIHHATRPDGKASEELKALLKDVLGSVSSSLGAPVCKTAVRLDVRSQYIRTEESAAANWFADIVKHAYDGALCVDGREGTGEHGAKIFAGHGVKAVEGGAGQIKGTKNVKSADLQPTAGNNQGKDKAGKTVDIVFICAGMLRGDSVYGPGDITLGDILEILPFEDPLVVLEVDGRTIWAALEAGLSTWPAQEGRFPVLAGVRVQWDSRKPKGQRVLSVKILKEKENSDDGGKKESEEVDVPNDESGEYVLLTREYMAQVSSSLMRLGRKH
jgi:5'-nucleotidase